MEPKDRLKEARIKAGYENASEAAKAMDWTPSTYISHENGTRGIHPHTAEKYARAFKVKPEWLLYNRGTKAPDPGPEKRKIDVVGYVGAGAETHYFGEQTPHDEVPAPEGASEETVAVEVRGQSLGPLFDRWLVFYDDVQRPVQTSLLGKLCVVGLADGRILVKQLKRARGSKLFHLISNTEPPITDVEVEWAAEVLSMAPR